MYTTRAMTAAEVFHANQSAVNEGRDHPNHTEGVAILMPSGLVYATYPGKADTRAFRWTQATARCRELNGTKSRRTAVFTEAVEKLSDARSRLDREGALHDFPAECADRLDFDEACAALDTALERLHAIRMRFAQK